MIQHFSIPKQKPWIRFLLELRWAVVEDTAHSLQLAGKFPWAGWKAYFNQLGELTIWADDGLQIILPEKRTPKTLKQAGKVCMYCHASVEKTTRLGFAGRACLPCAEKLRPTIEPPGWNR